MLATVRVCTSNRRPAKWKKSEFAGKEEKGSRRDFWLAFLVHKEPIFKAGRGLDSESVTVEKEISRVHEMHKSMIQQEGLNV